MRMIFAVVPSPLAQSIAAENYQCSRQRLTDDEEEFVSFEFYKNDNTTVCGYLVAIESTSNP
ncbi:MAG: hypothetical protein ACI9UN_004939 [Granulosicoccus sp.]|jgi:hypothetical protein